MSVEFLPRTPVSLSGIFGTRDSCSKYLVHDGALTNKRVYIQLVALSVEEITKQ